jgi:hypothetical protein
MHALHREAACGHVSGPGMSAPQGIQAYETWRERRQQWQGFRARQAFGADYVPGLIDAMPREDRRCPVYPYCGRLHGGPSPLG